MDVFEVIRVRKSVRAYESKPVPDELLRRILEAGQAAPSSSNSQPWHFIVIRSQEKRDVLSKRVFTRFLSEAPIVLVGCGEKKGKFCVVDVSIAMQQMVLAATAEGLGTCWIGDFDEKTVKELVKIPDNYNIICLLSIGYPREKIDLGAKLIRARSRKKLENIVSYEEYGNKK